MSCFFLNECSLMKGLIYLEKRLANYRPWIVFHLIIQFNHWTPWTDLNDRKQSNTCPLPPPSFTVHTWKRSRGIKSGILVNFYQIISSIQFVILNSVSFPIDIRKWQLFWKNWKTLTIASQRHSMQLWEHAPLVLLSWRVSNWHASSGELTGARRVRFKFSIYLSNNFCHFINMK